MTSIFGEHIGKCTLVSLDAILVMSRLAKEHLCFVMGILQQYHLKVMLCKCEFKPELQFLGRLHVVGREGIEVDPSKIAVIANWPLPKNLKEQQAFIGLGIYFRNSVPQYSSEVAPLTALCSRETARKYGWKAWVQKEVGTFDQPKSMLAIAQYCCP